MKKKLILAALAVVVLVVGVVGAAFASAFMGNATLQDGQRLGGGSVTTVVDGFVAAYLIDAGEGAFVLVDAGMDEAAAPIVAALKSRGVEPSAVKLILLTHGHGDHVGGAGAFPDAEVRALADELPLLEGAVAPKSPIGALSGKSDTGVRVQRPLVDGEKVVVGALSIETFAVPGHTAGSAAFLANGVLFFGDSAGSTTEGALKGAPWVFSDDTAANEAALKALAVRLSARANEVTELAFGHSAPLAGLQPLVAFEP